MEKFNLLLVDDEREFRHAIHNAMSRRGFAVSQAENGNNALQMIEQYNFDVIILDLCMPGMGGIETLINIRKYDKNLPVLILTGHGSLGEAVEGVRLGITDFMQKPVDINQLTSHIIKIVSKRKKSTLREKSISSLIVPKEFYDTIYEDQSLQEVFCKMRESISQSQDGKLGWNCHRTVLVYNREEKFIGCLRPNNLLALAVPPSIREWPYSAGLSGMFVGQCKLIGKIPVREFIDDNTIIDINASVMVALQLMVEKKLINLPVFKEGELVGIIRDLDIVLELSRIVTA